MTDSINCLIGLLALLGRRIVPTILIGVQGPVDAPPTPPPKGQTLRAIDVPPLPPPKNQVLPTMNVPPPPPPKLQVLHAMDVPPPPPPKRQILGVLDVAPVHPPKQQTSHSRTLLVPLSKEQTSHALVPYDVSSDDGSE